MPLRQGNLAPAIDAYLRKKGSPLAGLGSVFVSAGHQYGIDPRLIVAISGAETSLGTYGPSQKIHNPFGMGPGIQYPNYGQAIGAVAQNLSKNYIGQGLNTIPEIQRKWAPSGATNDPTGLNNNWVRNVSQYYRELGGDPGTAADVGAYAKTAAALESQYATMGDAPALTVAGDQQTPQPQDQPTQQLDFITPRQLSEASPIRSIGELTAKYSSQTITPTPRDTGSNAIANAAIQDTLRQTVTTTAAQHGLGVEFDDGTIVGPSTPAYIASAADYLKQHPVDARVLKQAKGFLGTPYVWGGESPATGFDCSGFAQWLYAQQGVKLPRVTYDQIKAGQGVGIKALEPGDLVFFGTKKNPHHEGIYIGNGQFIHAPHTGDVVKISSLRDGYYRRNFVTGRRVTG